MIANLRLYSVLGFMLPLTVALMPFQYLAVRLDSKLGKRFPRYWHRLLLRMIGVRVYVKGSISQSTPLMLVANHVSWSDIVVLASIADVSFIAKQEVASTPFAGLLAKLQRSVFVVREEKRKSGEQAREITQRLLQGDVIVLFAEGTTGDGHRVLDFKSALFGAAKYALGAEEIDAVHIQPVSIAYTKLHGIPMGRFQRARAAWPGDLELAPHATDFMRRSAWDVEVSFAEPLVYDGSQNRRHLAAQCRENVRKMFMASTFGVPAQERDLRQ